MSADSPYTFPHQRLEVYRLSLQLAAESKRVGDMVPYGYRTFRDQLLRSGGRVPLLIGEGANRFGHGQKRQRFNEARGECGEAASAAETIVVMGLLPALEVQRLMNLAGRVAAMLTKLVKRFS